MNSTSDTHIFLLSFTNAPTAHTIPLSFSLILSLSGSRPVSDDGAKEN